MVGVFVMVHLVSRVGADGPADETPKHARQDQTITLFAVVETDTGVFSDAPEIRLGKRRLRPRPLAEGPRVGLSWLKVEPTSENLSNTEGGSFRIRPIEYGEREVVAWRDRGAVIADVRPTLTPDRGGGVGTMRYRLAGGRAVHRVSIRRDDSYVGWLTELYGQPYIWASAGATARTHQAERLEGADCADFVTYGRRRLGHDVPYTWTGGLYKYTRRLAAGRPGQDGVYVDSRGRPLPFTRIGDLVLFPRHVGVLVEDRGTKGVLDREDVMTHTLFASPQEQAIGASGYGDRPLEIVRWK